MANRSKYVNFNFVVEYPIWVYIKRTLTGKLAEIHLLCSVWRKRPKTVKIRTFSEISYFWRFLDVFLLSDKVIDILTIYRPLIRQSSLDRHPYRVVCDKVRFWLFKGLFRFLTDLWWVQTALKYKTNQISLIYASEPKISERSVILGYKIRFWQHPIIWCHIMSVLSLA